MHDAQYDPRLELERQAGVGLAVRVRELKQQIDIWRAIPVSSATEVGIQEERLKQLHAELRRLQAKTPQMRRPKTAPAGFIAYPKAAALLAERLGASPDEIAMWIWSTPKDGGICAYRNANELSPPPRFFYDVLMHSDGDYLSPLMGCWFEQKEIEQFEPTDRFVTGSLLIERWAKYVSQPRAFIVAKISESRLNSFHPVFGGTREQFGQDEAFPSFDRGIFSLSAIEKIESEDFPMTGGTPSASIGSAQWRRENARKAAEARHSKPGAARDKHAAIRKIWATGKYDSKDRCAEEESRALNMSFAAARRALVKVPSPKRK